MFTIKKLPKNLTKPLKLLKTNTLKHVLPLYDGRQLNSNAVPPTSAFI